MFYQDSAKKEKSMKILMLKIQHILMKHVWPRSGFGSRSASKLNLS